MVAFLQIFFTDLLLVELDRDVVGEAALLAVHDPQQFLAVEFQVAEEEDGDDAISDSELFRRAMRDVRPLESAPRALPQARRPQARARFARAEREAGVGA